MSKKQLLLGSFLCLLAVTSWGFMFPVMASALQFIDPFFFTTIRYGSATIIFIILLLAFEGISSFRLEKKILSLLFFGTVGFAGYGFLVFLWSTISRTFRSHSCRYDSISYAASCFITTVGDKKINDHKTIHSFLCFVL
ncbi:EamA family transporter [Bacillus cytotoxicus]